ncbi:MAG: hypothetical protein LBD24_00430 [Spirochaetaceae bacterium]|nr:hypothetical protein [Spirochaetaceae bacterium]
MAIFIYLTIMQEKKAVKPSPTVSNGVPRCAAKQSTSILTRAAPVSNL